MKSLVIGDWVEDHYRLCESTRLCPEAPVPVLVETRKYQSPGGMGLVIEQLKALIGQNEVSHVEGSRSVKERIFADGHLVCRIDRDSVMCAADELEQTTVDVLKMYRPKLLIVSDYGKGAVSESSAKRIMGAAKENNVPVLVDAKKSWVWYREAYSFFPNEGEKSAVYDARLWGVRGSDSTFHYLDPGTHVIQKLGPKGCTVDGTPVLPKHERLVRDSTGAGDCFIAAFAAKLLTYPRELWDTNLVSCAEFANFIAGKSVEYVGTRVITGEKP